jgi:hypothetical protein
MMCISIEVRWYQRFKIWERCLNFSIVELMRRHYGIFEVTFENQGRLKLVFSMPKNSVLSP